MAWTTPRTWVAAELVTASQFNTHIRDNLNALRDYLLGAQDLGTDWKISSGRVLRFQDPDVAHGMTSQESTDVWGAIKETSGTAGGATFQGWSDTDAVAARLEGVVGSTGPSVTATLVNAYKKSGTTVAALAAGELVFGVQNGGSSIAQFYAGTSTTGGLSIVQGLNVGYALAAPAGPYLTVGDGQFRMYLTTSTIPAILFDAAESPGAGIYYERLSDLFDFTCGGTIGMVISATQVGLGTSAGLNLDYFSGGTAAPAGTILFKEVTTPGSPDANRAVLFVADNGAGKTGLYVKFPTGGASAIAVEA